MQDKWDITQSSIQQFDRIQITNNNVYEHVSAANNRIRLTSGHVWKLFDRKRALTINSLAVK